jgi:hypothetical protein
VQLVYAFFKGRVATVARMPRAVLAARDAVHLGAPALVWPTKAQQTVQGRQGNAQAGGGGASTRTARAAEAPCSGSAKTAPYGQSDSPRQVQRIPARPARIGKARKEGTRGKRRGSPPRGTAPQTTLSHGSCHLVVHEHHMRIRRRCVAQLLRNGLPDWVGGQVNRGLRWA